MTSDWETISYDFDEVGMVDIRQRWECDPPGPIGSGALYVVTKLMWELADDGVWERTVFRWRPASEDEAVEQ